MPNSVFLKKLIIQDRNRASFIAKSEKTYIKLWYDGFKFEKSYILVAIICKNHIRQKWQ